MRAALLDPDSQGHLLALFLVLAPAPVSRAGTLSLDLWLCGPCSAHSCCPEPFPDSPVPLPALLPPGRPLPPRPLMDSEGGACDAGLPPAPPRTGSRLLSADADGQIKCWSMADHLANSWESPVGSLVEGDPIVALSWLHNGVKLALHVEKVGVPPGGAAPPLVSPAPFGLPRPGPAHTCRAGSAPVWPAAPV